MRSLHDTRYASHRRSQRGPKGMEEHKLPVWNYYLDESDPDILLLRRQDDSFVAAFSACGATREGIVEAAMEDYRAAIENYQAAI
jgi:hypothetical protein